MTLPLIIGVDGGGTHSRLAAVQEDGTVVARAEGAGINYHSIGLEQARLNLSGAVQALLRNAGQTDYSVISIGMSALDQAASPEEIRAFSGESFAAHRVEMDSDVYMALMGATLGKPGIMVVSGTGAMVVGLDARGAIISRGGWGYRLDDPGSAYGVAIEAIKCALAAMERMGPGTLLAARAAAFFGTEDPREIVRVAYEPEYTPSRIAQFARAAIECAEAGDGEARRVIAAQLEWLAAMARSLLEGFPKDVQVSLYGGMLEHSAWVRGQLAARLKVDAPSARVGMLQNPPEAGAVIAHMLRRGALTEAFVRRMNETWNT